MPAAVYACDINGIITYCNPQAVELWGRTPELDGQPWLFLNSRRIYNADGTRIPPEDAPVRDGAGDRGSDR